MGRRRWCEVEQDLPQSVRAKWDSMFVGVLVLLSLNRTDVAPQLSSLYAYWSTTYAKPRASTCSHMLVGPAPLVLNPLILSYPFLHLWPDRWPFSMSWLHLAFVGAQNGPGNKIVSWAWAPPSLSICFPRSPTYIRPSTLWWRLLHFVLVRLWPGHICLLSGNRRLSSQEL